MEDNWETKRCSIVEGSKVEGMKQKEMSKDDIKIYGISSGIQINGERGS